MRERVDERWTDTEEAFRPSSRTYHEAHVEAVKDVAAQLYGFPTEEFPHYRTFANQPEPTQKVFTNYGHELTPDIVVLEWPERLPRILAEVLTPDMITEENARDVWAIESRIEGAVLYLYLPAGHVSEVKDLLKKFKIKSAGLRTWRRLAGMNQVDVAILR